MSHISKLKGACLWDRRAVPLGSFSSYVIGVTSVFVYGASNWIFVFKTTNQA